MARRSKKTPLGKRPRKKRQERPASEAAMEEENIGQLEDYVAPGAKPEDATWED